MEFEQAKVLGGVGGILCLLSMVSGVIGIVGIILLMIAFKSMADYYGRESIFKNALLALILEIVAVGVLLAFVGSRRSLYLGPRLGDSTLELSTSHCL